MAEGTVAGQDILDVLGCDLVFRVHLRVHYGAVSCWFCRPGKFSWYLRSRHVCFQSFRKRLVSHCHRECRYSRRFYFRARHVDFVPSGPGRVLACFIYPSPKCSTSRRNELSWRVPFLFCSDFFVPDDSALYGSPQWVICREGRLHHLLIDDLPTIRSMYLRGSFMIDALGIIPVSIAGLCACAV